MYLDDSILDSVSSRAPTLHSAICDNRLPVRDDHSGAAATVIGRGSSMECGPQCPEQDRHHHCNDNANEDALLLDRIPAGPGVADSERDASRELRCDSYDFQTISIPFLKTVELH